jgi:GAF domain-containing protein
MRVNDVNLVSFYKNVDQKTLSELCVPIKIHDQLIGVINAESTRAGFFSSDDEQLLDTIAGQLATAIEKIRHYEAARRRAAELESIRQVTLQLTTNLDLKSLLEALMESALQLVTSDTAHIFLFDGQVLKFGAAYWAEGEPQIVHDSPRQNGITYTVARSGQRMVVTDVYKHPLFQDNPWDGAVISLPLRHANRVLGVMNLAYHTNSI